MEKIGYCRGDSCSFCNVMSCNAAHFVPVLMLVFQQNGRETDRGGTCLP